MRYRRDPRPPATGLDGEDNYQIEVWDRQDGQLLGIALKTAMSGTMREAWRDAIETYPGRFLVWTNGPYIIEAAVAPTGEPDQWGWIDAGDVALVDLPQWYDLVGRCECGYMAFVDRYDPRVVKRQGYPVSAIAEKLPCPECKIKRKTRGKVKIGLRKLPR